VAADKIVFGATFPMTGPVGDYGKIIKFAIESYFKKVNDAGGVHGRKLEYLAYDDEWKPPLGIEKTKHLVEKDNVFAILTQLGTHIVSATQPYLTSQNVPIIGPISGAKNLVEPPLPNFFQTRVTFEQEIAASMKLLKNHLKVKKVGFFRTNDGTGHNAKLAVTKALHSEGLELVAEGMNSGAEAKDIIAEVKKMKAAGVQAIINFVPAAGGGEFMKQLKAAGINVPVIHGVTVYSPAFFKFAGDAVEGSFFSLVVPLFEGLPIAEEYRNMMASSGMFVLPHGLEGYLAAAVTVEALKKVGKDLTRDAFMRVLDDTAAGEIGGWKYSFSKNNHVGHQKTYFAMWKDGKAVPIQLGDDAMKSASVQDQSPKKM
jgi:ABC-type branched-subunit amino acid transport system substrate-binding protein